MKPQHKAIAAKLKDPKRLAKVLEALRAGRPAWVSGLMEDEQLIRETLAYMGVVV